MTRAPSLHHHAPDRLAGKEGQKGRQIDPTPAVGRKAQDTGPCFLQGLYPICRCLLRGCDPRPQVAAAKELGINWKPQLAVQDYRLGLHPFSKPDC